MHYYDLGAREGGNLSAEDKGFIPAEHPATDLVIAEIYGWWSLLGATPLLIICLNVALLKEALQFISRGHRRFLLSHHLPMHCHVPAVHHVHPISGFNETKPR